MIKIIVMSETGGGRSTVAAYIVNMLQDILGLEPILRDGEPDDPTSAGQILQRRTELYRRADAIRRHGNPVEVETRVVNRAAKHDCYDGQVSTFKLGELKPCPECNPETEKPMHPALRNDEITEKDVETLLAAAHGMTAIRVDDDVVVTGKITSSDLAFVKDVRGVVATVSDDGFVKIWPADENDPKLPAGHNGKLWFNTKDPTTRIEVVPSPRPSARQALADALGFCLELLNQDDIKYVTGCTKLGVARRIAIDAVAGEALWRHATESQ